MKALVKWCVYALVTGRRARLDLDTSQFFDIADTPGASYADKLDGYRQLADAYFETERYQDFCAQSLPRLDEIVLDWVGGPGFDQLLVEHRSGDLPGARARPVHRAPARPARAVGPGRERPAAGWLTRAG